MVPGDVELQPAPSITGRVVDAKGDPLANVVVSNVRATPVPLYVGGAKIESMYPLSILGPSQGLNATLVSYMGHVDVGFTVDPQLVPDPWALADAVPQYRIG